LDTLYIISFLENSTQEGYYALTKGLFKKYGVQLAYLFGSAVHGKTARESDVDIAVLLSERFSKKKRFEIRLALMEQLARRFKNKVDVVILNDVSSLLFKYAILREGKLICRASESAMIDFENRIMGEYFDFQPFLKLYHEHYVKKRMITKKQTGILSLKNCKRISAISANLRPPCFDSLNAVHNFVRKISCECGIEVLLWIFRACPQRRDLPGLRSEISSGR